MKHAHANLNRRSRGALSTAILCALVVGCSIEKNYRLLSFLFDGVPDPALLAANANAVEVAKLTGGVFYSHDPYLREQCWECHGDPRQPITAVQPQVCLKCHATVNDQHKFMHGPVAANACLWCHSPHESTVKSLLRSTGPQLCRQCHGPGQMGSPKSPVHSDLNRDCMDCHAGHGGGARFFLKEDWTLPSKVAP